MRSDLARHEVAHHNAFGLAVDHDHVEHFRSREHLHGAQADLAAEGLIRAEQQLLPGLAAGVKRARYLRSTEGAIRQQTTVLAGEGNTLRHTLVDDIDAY